EIIQPVPLAHIMPIAPVVPVTPEVAPEPMPQEEKPKKTVKSRAKKTVKAEEKQREETPKTEEKPQEPKTEQQTEEKKEEVKTAQEVSPKGTLMDMSFLLGETKPAPKKSVPVIAPKTETESKQEKTEIKEEKQEVKQAPQVQKIERAPVQKQEVKTDKRKQEKNAPKKQPRALTADEKLQEAFLSRLHRLGGNYFEYYSVYLLERYSRKNGRRLESLKITGGDRDGGIDGEIELTDRLGFRETIYIQAKNWDPDKGDEKLWIVGETLLQQFIGACVCRQAKDGKQNCRGIFITTSRFTNEARKILNDTADKFVGYDGADLYEAAKECEFGIVKKNGAWALDEELLSSEKAFFRAF
ncbi:MAG: restriction endonuclease, partial [Clostridia bacterium]|nr:restriction endonuclease [Clostridia bacterium]